VTRRAATGVSRRVQRLALDFVLLAVGSALFALAGGLLTPAMSRADSTVAGTATATTTATATATATTTTTTTTPVPTAPVGPTVTPAYGLPYQQLTPYSAQAPTQGALETDGQTNRYTLSGTWLYRPDPSNIGISQGFWRDSADTVGWSEVAVPNAWNAGEYTATGFAGTVGWYRRDFTLPANAFSRYVPSSGHSWMLEFESINYTAEVWLNGHELGTHTGAYLPFELAAKYMVAGTNRLVIRVDDTHTPSSFPPGPSSGWWNFGGILDAVYLLPVQEADLDSATITPTLACPTCSATVNEQATIRNLSAKPQTVELTGRYGSLKLNFGEATIKAGQSWTPSASGVLEHPKLWAPGSPNLYAATLTLTDVEGRALGGYRYESGVREITWSDGLLYLNGRQLHLRGVSVHEQTVQTGAALSVAQQAQLISWAQQLGADIIREHYPLDPEAEEMADQDGILLWSEVPVYGSLLTAAQNNANAASPTWRAGALALLKSNIETNENHPSILVWSIANELQATVSTGEAIYIRAAAAEVHALDPTRPAAMAIEDWPGLACQPTAYAPLDVLGINEYFGWFDENGGQTEDRQSLEPFLESVRNCYSNKALMVTEVGYGGDRAGPVEVRGTYAYQDDNLTYSMGVFGQLSWLAGAIWFPMQDFAVEPGYDGGEPLGSPPFVDKGVVDQFGNEKPSFAVMQALYQSTQQLGPAPSRRSVSSLR
jgi:beta-glucuronidase